MKKKFYLLSSLLAMTLSITGCKEKDPSNAKAEDISNTKAEEMIGDAASKVADKVKEVTKGNLIGASINVGAEASGKLTIVQGQSAQNTVSSTLEASAKAAAVFQANIDLDGLKEINGNSKHADFSKTELYGSIELNAQASIPKEISGDTEDLDESVSKVLKIGIKEGKQITCEDDMWQEQVLEQEEIDEGASTILEAINVLNEEQQSLEPETVEVTEMISQISAKYIEYKAGLVTSSEFVDYIDTTVFSGYLSSSLPDGLTKAMISSVLDNLNNTNFADVVSYTCQGSEKIGYVLNASFNYDVFKSKVNGFISSIYTDPAFASVALEIGQVSTVVTTVLNAIESLTINSSIRISKDGALESVNFEFASKGNALPLLMYTVVSMDSRSSVVAANYELSAKCNFDYVIGSNKVTVETLSVPTE